MEINWDRFVQEVMDRIDLSEFIGQYTTLKKRGANWMGLCPLHGDKDPSFSVSPDKGLWHCFGCKKGGNVFTFVMEKESMNFIEAAEFISDRYNITFPKTSDKEEKTPKRAILDMHIIAEKFFADFLRSNPGVKFRDYLRERKITKEMVERFDVGASPDSWDSLLMLLKKKGYTEDLIVSAGLAIGKESGGAYDRFRNRLMIPIKDHLDRTVGFGGRVLDKSEPKYLNSPESRIFKKSEILFAFPLAKESIQKTDSAIIMEGYTDVMRAHQHGITNAVASMGTALTSQHIKRLSRYTRNIIIAFDGDDAGKNAALRSAEELIRTDIPSKAVIFDGGLDPEEYLRVKGKKKFLEKLSEARDGIWLLIDSEIPASLPGSESERIEILKRIILRLEVVKYAEARESLVTQIAPILELTSRLAGQVYRMFDAKEKNKVKFSGEKTESTDTPDELERNLMVYIVNFPKVRYSASEHLKPSEFAFYPYNKFLSMVFSLDNYYEIENLQILPDVITNDEFMGIVSEMVNILSSSSEAYTLDEFSEMLYKFKMKAIDSARRKNQRLIKKAELEKDEQTKTRLQKENEELARTREKYRTEGIPGM